MLLFGAIAAPVAATPTQATIFTDLGTYVTSFNGGRGVVARTTISDPSGYNSARTNQPLGTGGKWAWRTVVTMGRAAGLRATFVGVGNVSATLANWPGSDTNGWCYLSDTSGGYVGYNGASTPYGTAAVAGDFVDVAIDLAAGSIWYGINGSWLASGNPATGANPSQTGLTGTLYPMVGMFGGGSGYLNPDEAMTLPAGFSALP